MSLFGGKKKKEAAQTVRLLERLDGRELQAAVRREPSGAGETVIGKGGRLNTLGGEIVIVCDGAEVFRCPAAQTRCGELMSLNGLMIRRALPDGGEDVVIAYYKYYRKL